MDRIKISLTQKALAALVIILLPILVTFLFSYYQNLKLLKKHFLADLELIAEGIEGQVYQFLEIEKRGAVDFSSDGFIISELEKFKKEPGRSPAELNRHLNRKKRLLSGMLDGIEVITADGRVVASTDPAFAGRDLSGEDFFKKGIKALSIRERMTGSRGQPEIAISAPVAGNGGEVIGVITNLVPLSKLEYVLNGEMTKMLGGASPAPQRGETFEAYLVNRDRLMITGSRFIKDAQFKQAVVSEPVNLCLASGREMTGYYADYRGVQVSGSSMCMPSLGWTLLVEIDRSEALYPATVLGVYAAVTAVIVALLIIALFVTFHRSVVLQLRMMSGAASAISEGNYDALLPVRTGDEIGALSESFNMMASSLKTGTHALRVSEEKYRSLISNIPDVTWSADLTGKVTFVSHNVEAVLGYTPEEIYGRPEFFRDSIHPDDLSAVTDAYGRLFSEGLSFDAEYRFSKKGGQWIWVHDRASATYLKDGIRYADGVFSDISVRKKAELALKESEERLKKAQEVAHMGSWDWDVKDDKLFWSDEIYRIFGLTPREFGATYEAFLKAVHPADREFVEHSVQQSFYHRKPYSIEHRIVLPDKTERIVREEADVLTDGSGNPVKMLGTVQDITEQKKYEFELKKLSMIIEQSVNLVFITGREGTIEYVNPAFEAVTGFTREEAVGQNPRIIASGDVPTRQYGEMWDTILSGKTWRSTFRNRKKSGGYYWANSVITPIRNDRGEISHFLAVQEDVTEKMVTEERINYLANYDELTGLINRASFIKKVEEWIHYASASTRACKGLLCLIDMDQFKMLNDTFGHGAGDEYLRRTAALLDSTLVKLHTERTGKEDAPVLTRLSGDEFAFFMACVSEQEGLDIVEEIRKAIEGFYFTEASSSMTASSGVVFYPEHGRDIKELLTKADAATFRAKELGRNRAHLYRPEDQDLEKMHSRLSWKEKILKGLKEDRFVPWFQPIMDLNSNSVHHYEALARFKDEDGKILLPGAFIDIAERFGIIGLIDRVIIEKTMRTQAGMSALGKRFSFGMNLSGKDLGDEGLLAFIEDKIKETGADPECLVFEITETAAIGDLGRATRFVRSLKETGCHFSLDDFGVGFTSFTYLKEMQVDYIKIDGSFIRKLSENPNDQVFVKAITDVAKGLNIFSIAEFVENEETLKLLKEFKVDFAQGYLIGKPAPTLELAGDFLIRQKIIMPAGALNP